MTTPYHARFFANELTRQGGEGVERLSRSLFDACVDLNPHQIEAALFALRSPVSKGVLLADEVGLGKTIEAGLAICQSWAERHRRVLVVCPASLRKQWALELEEKFHLPTLVLDAKTYREQVRDGNLDPFTNDRIVICSLHFASSRAAEIKPIQWDLVVIDEAHKLRNAYRQNNRMGQNIRWALEDRRKVLLTATPLQNSLLELYGLSTIIDERIFGDLPSYRTQYVNVGGNLQELRGRLESWTLRRFILDGKAAFDDQALSFRLTDPPIPSVHSGTYHMISKGRENVSGEFLYRLGHPLGEFVIQAGKDYPTPVVKVMFDISGHQARISVIEDLKGKSGWLILQRLIIDSFEREEYLLFSGFEDDGMSLDQETCEKIFNCRGQVLDMLDVPEDERQRLAADADRHAKATISKSLERNNHHFNEARGQLEKWADDMVLAAEKELHDTKEQIKALNRQARQATTVEEQHQLQKKIKDIEKKKRRQRQRIFDVEDEIMEKRDSLIDALEKRMQQRMSTKPLFTIRWEVQ